MRIKSHEDTVHQARSMGEDFAKIRGRALLETFLKGSGLAEELYNGYRVIAESMGSAPDLSAEDHLKHALNDYDEAFGSMLALSYALGQIDGVENTRSDLYRKGKDADKTQQGEKPAQLTLPGMDV